MPQDSDAGAPRNTISGFDIRALLAYIATGILTIAFAATNIIVFYGVSGEGRTLAIQFVEKGQILITAFTIILALPLGIVINASSFFLFERSVVFLERRVWRFAFSPIMGGKIGKKVVCYFSIKDRYEFQDKGVTAIEMLKMYLPSAYRSYQHISGLGILFRVSFMLCLFEAIILFWFWGGWWGASAIIVALLLLLVSALANTYLYWHCLFICYLVGRHQLKVQFDKDQDLFRDFLDKLAESQAQYEAT